MICGFSADNFIGHFFLEILELDYCFSIDLCMSCMGIYLDRFSIFVNPALFAYQENLELLVLFLFCFFFFFLSKICYMFAGNHVYLG